MNFLDRTLKCSDCGNEFVFTAGEQLFFFEKQFKNDPKRCKLCKAKRSGLGRMASESGVATLPLSRTETRTECSACGEGTTVPFKPTQGRPVLCRSCFQLKRLPTAVVKVAALHLSSLREEAAAPRLAVESGTECSPAQTTLEMIATVPAAALQDLELPAETLMTMAAEAPQA